jgi:deoxyribodipyrimidine photo-lyase
MEYVIFWFRRDLRLEDNTALTSALKAGIKVLPIFIFDDEIIDELPNDDPRVGFIYSTLNDLDQELRKNKSSLLCLKGNPIDVWEKLTHDYDIKGVYVNKDYEPYALHRDLKVRTILESKGIGFFTSKDQVIFEELEITKADGLPYTVFTPYKKKWLSNFSKQKDITRISFDNFHNESHKFPSITELGFDNSKIKVRNYDLTVSNDYGEVRDFPALDRGSYLGPHLRFGTISIRKVISSIEPEDTTFLNELIWREFFMQILYNFPHVVNQNFKSKYNGVGWINSEINFESWCNGKTGYPIVDAGMRQLNETGYMHNRVRMITAGFLCKHLLIDWRWGEGYFAQKLLDYELASNNGNWQWAAGTGCDAAPYFRIFNPTAQTAKFDKQLEYINRWVTEFNTDDYPKPIIKHKFARQRALEVYKKGILG